MEDKKLIMLKCSICGREHLFPQDRAKCELSCCEKVEKEKLKNMKAERFKEIQTVNEKLSNLISTYEKDYGEAIYWL